MALGTGLEADPYGSVQTTGSVPSEPSALLYGSNGFVGVGAGLQINAGGDIEALSCDLPPYYCNTAVNPHCVADFSQAWRACPSLITFPPLDTSSGTNFSFAWYGCTYLSTFYTLDTSSGVDFSFSWANTNLSPFPPLDFSSAEYFIAAWQQCTNLTTFPAGVFDNCSATNFQNAWSVCSLNQTSVDNILVSIDTAGESNGTLGINGGMSSAPSATGLAAKLSLQGKGWTVSTN